MLLHRSIFLVIALIVVSTCDLVCATEPNESFAQATQLAPGVLSVDDAVAPGFLAYPDTVLGIRDQFGEVYFTDDDGSPVGDGRASGLGGVPTNSGSIDFAISGYPDEGFFGDHGESGQYEVFVDVYDFFDDLVDSFSEVRTLQPGNVDDFSFSNFEWISGSYDVYIDNTVGGASQSDVDFFTFNGLVAGSSFTAQVTQDTPSGFDSLLGWFNAAGTLIDSDDNDGAGNLSLLAGVVPANGKLTFAVTGVDDINFVGLHDQDAEYSLELTIGAARPGDFDNDGDVDGRDFLKWQRGGSPNPKSAADLVAWQTHYGTNGLVAATVAVPEPAALGLSALVFVALRFFRKPNR